MVDKEKLVSFYEMMLRIMVWEQGLLRLIDENKVSGFYHPGRGQEAVPTGACAALRDDDYIMYSHRGCGYMIAKGLSMVKMYGDFIANEAGTTKGLGAGIVHIACPELGILGQSGTLGGCFPIAVGAALSAQYRGTDQVCLCFFGEGTANRGTFHESLNAASIWKVPVIWLCENNLYGMSTHIDRSTATRDIVSRAAAYDIPGIIVDGMNPVAVYEAVATAVDRARQGGGPTLIEAKTYRFRGHFEGDPCTYRSTEELECWKKRDPIQTLASQLVADGILNESDLAAIRSKIKKEVDDAAEEALKAPFPPENRLFEYVYA